MAAVSAFHLLGKAKSLLPVDARQQRGCGIQRALRQAFASTSNCVRDRSGDPGDQPLHVNNGDVQSAKP